MKISAGKRLARDFDVREKAPVIAIVILVWLALNLVFAFLVNVPRVRRVAALTEVETDLATRIHRDEKGMERLRGQFRRVMAGRDNLDKFYTDVLSTKQERLISFQKEIRDIARQFNVNVDSITYPREEFRKDKVAKFSATMPLTGSYENLREFIKKVEQSSNFIVIEAIQLANSKEGGIVLSLSIQLSTYFVDPEMRGDDTADRARRS